ncbi:hypothetical protein TWF191_007430 [Orbilia oligospora]|uniref:UBC core domain-containing protein n=2 Tax=Orbilia oligospora TaxID=2813651 RepID=A0A7C8UUH7_ORBOL|nr:hypothetical protein TWF191_007430 [Orbilia oligospora]
MLTSQSFRERQLLTEFATLRTAPIPGVYLTPHPTTPTTWYGVIFLHSSKNLYSNLPIRFTITFPTKYPEVPPFVVLHATSSGSDDLDRNWNGNGGVVIHPLVSRGGIINNRGFGGVGGSIFTDKYLEGLERRFEEEKKGVPNTPISPEVRTPVGSGSGSGLGNEAAVIVDDEAWNLWKNDREELRRRVDEVRRAGLEEGGVYQEWEGSVGAGGDVPIRFLDLERAALDTIKENLGRRFEGVEG